ncbi:alpha/beta hydrolase [Streptomyces sp. AM 2-1-1]|uniref:alpha/beta hydrolase n=1 Tax=Streptomyces sp. AM 2-1-1 TaxID=3028709 RepID=UPI0023B98849|nr:alpha/beta hydrolase [Streptomyces sp. AM 2-1-1]WEH43199.1 alpha/beta hydrolase [Streptomyces sp. AM 2-1-1]
MPRPFPFELLAPPDPLTLRLPPAAHPFPGVRLLRAVPYGVLDGGRPLELDLWLSDDVPGPRPVIVFVHGGAWRQGLRDDMGPFMRDPEPGPFARLAAAGFAVACVDYRLSGEAVFPAQLDDLRTALGWLHARSGELGTDSSRTVLWGASAGGHLAALTALADPAGTAAVPPVRGCVVWYAPTDLGALAEDCPPGRFDPGSTTSFEALLLGGAPDAQPALVAAASPAKRAGPGSPPFLVLHGTDDTLVPVAQGRRLAAALRAAAVPVDFREIEGADHLWVGIEEDRITECFLTSLRFARSVTAGPVQGGAEDDRQGDGER